MSKRALATGKKNRPSSPEEAFGRVLKQMRRERSLSQEALAYKGGYHRTYIGQLERAEKSPSLRTLVALADSLEILPSRIMIEIEMLLGR